jgi:PIN domain nuclease of toxin-antitoxin system
VKLLLDTNIIMLAAMDTLPEQAKAVILENKQSCYFSIAAIWEMVIKDMSDRFALKRTPKQIIDSLTENYYRMLDIKAKHIYELYNLQAIHKDPFDRIMLAQANSEGMILLTTDELLSHYGSIVHLCKK